MNEPSNYFHYFDDESKQFNPSQKLAEEGPAPLPKNEPEKPKVDMSVPRSSKPIHRVIPLFFIAFALFFLAIFVSNLFCNFGNKIASENASTHALGIVGYWVSYFFFGEFSAGAFLYPVLLLNLAIRWKKYVDKKNQIEKCIFSFFTPFFLSMLLQVFAFSSETEYTKDVLRTAGFSLQGGGVIGGWLGNQLCAAVNKVGAAVILICCLIGLVFYLVGVTPQYLAQHSRIKKDIHDEKHALEEEDKEEKANIEREKKLQKKLRKERNEKAEANPISNVGNALIVATSSKDKLAPMPLPNLLVSESDDLYIPDYISQELSQSETKVENGENKTAKKEDVDEDTPDEVFPVEKKKERKSNEFDLGDVFGFSEPAEDKKETEDPLIAFYDEESKKENDLLKQKAEHGEPSAPIFVYSDAIKELKKAPVANNDDVEDYNTNGRFDIFKAMGGGKKSSATGTRTYGENPLDGVAPIEDKDEPYAPPQPIFAPFKPLSNPADNKVEEVVKSNAPEIITEMDEGESANKDDDLAESYNAFVDSEDDDAEEFVDEVVEVEEEKEETPEEEELSEVEETEISETPTKEYDQMSLGEVLEDREKKQEEARKRIEKEESMTITKVAHAVTYYYPPFNFLHSSEPPTNDYLQEIKDNQDKLAKTLESFKIGFDSIRHSNGPSITRYEISPSPGVSVSKFIQHESDIALSLAVKDIRMEAPIDGMSAVGIEVPKKNKTIVYLRELLEREAFTGNPSPLLCCLGVDVTGKPIYTDIGVMPHLLVAGATGMGKSVCINSLIMSILYKSSYNDVKFILIDPKKVEFTRYKNIPHLAIPIVTSPKEAAGALNAAVEEMERRYELLMEEGVVDADAYNIATKNDPDKPYIPKLVIVIDELADLMLTAREQVETSISRLLAKARAAGIHLIIATQRPSVDVITGLLKANLNSRIALPVASNVDSKCILDHGGAEKLCGKGDMLYAPIGAMHETRVQGTFVSNEEVEKVCNYLRETNGPAKYSEALMEKVKFLAESVGAKKNKNESSDYAPIEKDTNVAKDSSKITDEEAYKEAVRIALTEGHISTSLLERKLSLGYSRAAKLLDRMEANGIISAQGKSSRPRQILMTIEDYVKRFGSLQDDNQKEN